MSPPTWPPAPRLDPHLRPEARRGQQHQGAGEVADAPAVPAAFPAPAAPPAPAGRLEEQQLACVATYLAATILAARIAAGTFLVRDQALHLAPLPPSAA